MHGMGGEGRHLCAHGGSSITGVITRLVRNCALGRVIQYAEASVGCGKAAEYWIPRLRGV